MALRSALEIINHSIDELEGGFVNNKADRGGPTNYGITHTTLASYLGKPTVTVDEVKNMKRSVAVDIYLTMYYHPYKIDLLPPCLRCIVFDMGINHGPKNAAKMLQWGLINLGVRTSKADGAIGPLTAAEATVAIKRFGERTVLQEIFNQRRDFYRRIIEKDPTQEVFKNGWENRVKWFENNLSLQTEAVTKPPVKVRAEPLPVDKPVVNKDNGTTGDTGLLAFIKGLFKTRK